MKEFFREFKVTAICKVRQPVYPPTIIFCSSAFISCFSWLFISSLHRKCQHCCWRPGWWGTRLAFWTGWALPCVFVGSRCTSASKHTAPNVSTSHASIALWRFNVPGTISPWMPVFRLNWGSRRSFSNRKYTQTAGGKLEFYHGLFRFR